MKIGDKIETQRGDYAEIISIIEKDGERFAVLTLDNQNDTSDIHIAKIVETEQSEILEETEDREITDYVLKIIANKVRTMSDDSEKVAENKTTSDGMITRNTLGNTRVTEENMDMAIDIMKQLIEEDK